LDVELLEATPAQITCLSCRADRESAGNEGPFVVSPHAQEDKENTSAAGDEITLSDCKFSHWPQDLEIQPAVEQKSQWPLLDIESLEATPARISMLSCWDDRDTVGNEGAFVVWPHAQEDKENNGPAGETYFKACQFGQKSRLQRFDICTPSSICNYSISDSDESPRHEPTPTSRQKPTPTPTPTSRAHVTSPRHEPTPTPTSDCADSSLPMRSPCANDEANFTDLPFPRCGPPAWKPGKGPGALRQTSSGRA
jgi:hypothetical protein